MFSVDFMDDLKTTPPAALVDLLNNLFWEIPIEYTPDQMQTEAIIRMIESRQGADRCSAALEICRDYVRAVFHKGCPAAPARQVKGPQHLKSRYPK